MGCWQQQGQISALCLQPSSSWLAFTEPTSKPESASILVGTPACHSQNTNARPSVSAEVDILRSLYLRTTNSLLVVWRRSSLGRMNYWCVLATAVARDSLTVCGHIVDDEQCACKLPMEAPLFPSQPQTGQFACMCIYGISLWNVPNKWREEGSSASCL